MNKSNLIFDYVASLPKCETLNYELHSKVFNKIDGFLNWTSAFIQNYIDECKTVSVYHTFKKE